MRSLFDSELVRTRSHRLNLLASPLFRAGRICPGTHLQLLHPNDFGIDTLASLQVVFGVEQVSNVGRDSDFTLVWSKLYIFYLTIQNVACGHRTYPL